jgi:hypothetical protein
VSLDFDGYFRALLQNAGISLSRIGDLKDRFNKLELTYASVADVQLIHGKDAMAVLSAALSNFGVTTEECPRLLWTTFDLTLIENGSVLKEVAHFLSTL